VKINLANNKLNKLQINYLQKGQKLKKNIKIGKKLINIKKFKL
jgi:hypothetical protein